MKRRKTSGIGILVAAQDRQAVPHRSELGCLGGEDLLGKLARQGIVGANSVCMLGVTVFGFFLMPNRPMLSCRFVLS
jgi:hypothetical protein